LTVSSTSSTNAKCKTDIDSNSTDLLHTTIVVSVAVFGITPPSVSNQTFQLDNQKFQYSQPSYQSQLFTIPDPNNFSSSYGFAEFVTFDYILITVSNETNLAGQTILIDDSSTEITWNGSWEAKPTNVTVDSHLNLPEKITMAAHGNGTHVSSKEGDSFTFQFAGKLKSSLFLV
jgi:hypothetical protein